MMNELNANKVLAVILFNGLKEKMELFDESINCRIYRVSSYDDYEYRVSFITPNIHIRHDGKYIGSISDTKCTLENDDVENAEIVVDGLLAVSQVFVDYTEFTVSVDTSSEDDKFMVLDVNNDAVEKLDALHDLLIKGITNLNF